ncbi:MAG: hypothetical protein RIS35_53, partial [Pseudomonadota bacterium]
MKRRNTLLALGAAWTGTAFAQLPNLGDVLKGVDRLPKAPGSAAPAGAADDRTNVAGIREALAVGTERAVKGLARPDGYFGNQAVRILMPESLRKVADVARMAGYQQQVDDFVLSMNRAAEAAVPLAADQFGNAIRGMTLDDVRGILTGGDTAATEFFRRKTQDSLYAAFKPIVSRKVDEVGATRAYKTMMGRYENVPFVGKQSLDLDDYVTRKSLDGLFLMVGEEEKRIRTDPVAR